MILKIGEGLRIASLKSLSNDKVRVAPFSNALRQAEYIGLASRKLQDKDSPPAHPLVKFMPKQYICQNKPLMWQAL